ncbi:MAG TPA: hypothetical protein VFV63_08705 [Ilumatobacteraceae bacterium]|nr:hypothetical protein [Ilumatobacteraceae bacterium]
MGYDLSIVNRLVADRQHAFRSTADATQPGGHHPTRSYNTVLQRSFASHRPRRPARGRRWPS